MIASRGDIVLTASIKERNVQNLKTIKSLAILRGVQQCIHLGLLNLIIESNCQLVVKEITSPEQSHSLLGNIFCNIKALMAAFQ